MELKKAIEEIRKNEQRKFEQTIELIVNLKKFDIKKNQINTFIIFPHKFKDKKICGFTERKSSLIDTISKPEFQIYSNKKKLKQIVKKYDFFISSAKNMPAVATAFGRVLGPAGKMPSPKLGVLIDDSEKNIQELKEKIDRSAKILTKEPSIKIAIAKEKMKDDEIIDNIKFAYNALINELPAKKDNVKNVMIKLTMGKPIKVEI